MNEARPAKDIPTTASGVYDNIPADRLADSYKEILCLFGNGRESFQDDVTIFGANPKGTRSMVGFQVEPREILIHEDMRNKIVLLSSVGWKRCLSVAGGIPPFFSELACQSTKINSSSAWYERRLSRGVFLLCVVRICEIDISCRTKSLARRNLGRALPGFKARQELKS